MSTPRGIGDGSVALSSLIRRSRSYTCSGFMLTTCALLQSLDVDDVLWPAGRELQGDDLRLPGQGLGRGRDRRDRRLLVGMIAFQALLDCLSAGTSAPSSASSPTSC